jgi:hypothetical protein
MTHDYKILPPDIVDPTEEEKDEAMEKVEPLMAFGISCACLVAGGTTGVAEGWAIGAEGQSPIALARMFIRRLTHTSITLIRRAARPCRGRLHRPLDGR